MGEMEVIIVRLSYYMGSYIDSKKTLISYGCIVKF